MEKLFSKFTNFFRSRTFAGTDRFGNRYFARSEEIDGVLKEKRWVIFKGEDDPTSIPVEWICWLNGQRKRAPSPEEIAELEARRERIKLNIQLRKEEEKRSKSGILHQSTDTSKIKSPDLKSFVQQFPGVSFDKNSAIDYKDEPNPKTKETRSTELTGYGESFKPGTWQPPT